MTVWDIIKVVVSAIFYIYIIIGTKILNAFRIIFSFILSGNVIRNNVNDIPLNGEKNPLVDGVFDEKPAKWTGNGSRKVKPDQND